MKEIKIDKDVPIPSRKNTSKILEYPFDKLEEGESFVIPDKMLSESQARYLCGKAWWVYKKMCVTRKVEEG